MKVVENTDNRLVIEDNHADKKLALTIGVVIFLLIALYLLYELDWMIALAPGIAALVCYVMLKRENSVNILTLNKSENRISFSMNDGRETTEFSRPYTELVEAQTTRKRSSSSGTTDSYIYCPILVFVGNEEFPLRKYHSAGSQSRDMADAINAFMQSEPTSSQD